MGELYAYLPQSGKNTEHLMLVPPRSVQHPDYGFSVGRGAFKFVTGRWMRITERVKVNSLGREDGECIGTTATRALRDTFTSYLQAKLK